MRRGFAARIRLRREGKGKGRTGAWKGVRRGEWRVHMMLWNRTDDPICRPFKSQDSLGRLPADADER